MGELESFHLFAAGEAMILKGYVPLLQQPQRPQTPRAGVVRQVHPVKPDGMKSAGLHSKREQNGTLQCLLSCYWRVKALGPVFALPGTCSNSF